VSCNDNYTWRYGHINCLEFNHSNKSEKGYLKLNDMINISIKKYDGQKEFLRSHDIQFTVGDKSFQEVVCPRERIGGNDEVSIIS